MIPVGIHSAKYFCECHSTTGTGQRLMEVTYWWAWTKSPFYSQAYRTRFFSLYVSSKHLIFSSQSAQRSLLITTGNEKYHMPRSYCPRCQLYTSNPMKSHSQKERLGHINTETKLVTSRKTITSPHSGRTHSQRSPSGFLPLKQADK